MQIDLVAITSNRRTFLGGEVEAHDSAQLTATDTPRPGAAVEIEIVYDGVLSRYVAASVQVRRSGDGDEVTAKLVREVRVQEAIVSVALASLIFVVDGKDEQPAESWLETVAPARGREREQVERDAAIIYTVARLGSWPPLATVAERLSVSQSTATRIIAGARDRFVLDSSHRFI